MRYGSNSRQIKRDREREADRHALSLSPTPNLSNAERMRICRCLDEISKLLFYWLTQAEGHYFKWMPYKGSITEKSEEHYKLAREFYDESSIDKYGYLERFHNPKQRATNRISVASWYVNSVDQAFYVVKVIHSPIPCDTWGWRPLTRKQWSIIALEIMSAHQDWQWVHAVREYCDDETFDPAGIIGWHMEPAKRIYTKDYVPCIGQVIYHHAIAKFLPDASEE